MVHNITCNYPINDKIDPKMYDRPADEATNIRARPSTAGMTVQATGTTPIQLPLVSHQEKPQPSSRDVDRGTRVHSHSTVPSTLTSARILCLLVLLIEKGLIKIIDKLLSIRNLAYQSDKERCVFFHTDYIVEPFELVHEEPTVLLD